MVRRRLHSASGSSAIVSTCSELDVSLTMVPPSLIRSVRIDALRGSVLKTMPCPGTDRWGVDGMVLMAYFKSPRRALLCHFGLAVNGGPGGKLGSQLDGL